MSDDLARFSPPGWTLLGRFPDEPDGVGSWLLEHGGEAMLLEFPPGLTVATVRAALDRSGATLRYATASHAHEDHFDIEAWTALAQTFPAAGFRPPVWREGVGHDGRLALGGEPVWLVSAPKHSWADAVAVFRGVAMTGDIETGQLASVNREVPARTRRASMRWYAGFPARTGYRVHTAMSAHLNSFRADADWDAMFTA